MRTGAASHGSSTDNNATPAHRNVVDGVEVRLPPSVPRALQKWRTPPRFAPDILRFIGRNLRKGAQRAR